MNAVNAPRAWNRACRELAGRDKVMAELIERHPGDKLRGSGDGFRTLVNAIVGQQISVAAASAIWDRLRGQHQHLRPQDIALSSPEALRAIGLSRRKAEYLMEIARAFHQGELDPADWNTMSDEEIRSELMRLRGVGRWTADMVLIFHLYRPDVLPIGDLGLVNSAARLYGNGSASGAPLRERQDWLRSYAEHWRPWRTVATWFIWLHLDADPVVY